MVNIYILHLRLATILVYRWLRGFPMYKVEEWEVNWSLNMRDFSVLTKLLYKILLTTSKLQLKMHIQTLSPVLTLAIASNSAIVLVKSLFVTFLIYGEFVLGKMSNMWTKSSKFVFFQCIYIGLYLTLNFIDICKWYC